MVTHVKAIFESPPTAHFIFDERKGNYWPPIELFVSPYHPLQKFSISFDA